MSGSIFQGFKNWLATPFQANMSAFGWFAFFGLLIVISVLWSFVLSHTLKGIG
jgi:hypothetical protein